MVIINILFLIKCLLKKILWNFFFLVNRRKEKFPQIVVFNNNGNSKKRQRTVLCIVCAFLLSLFFFSSLYWMTPLDTETTNTRTTNNKILYCLPTKWKKIDGATHKQYFAFFAQTHTKQHTAQTRPNDDRSVCNANSTNDKNSNSNNSNISGRNSNSNRKAGEVCVSTSIQEVCNHSKECVCVCVWHKNK